MATVLFCSIAGSALGAAEPILSVERDGTYPGHHPLSLIEKITFAGDTLFVSEVSERLSTYPLDTVTRVWFDLSGTATSALTDPKQAAAIVRALHLFQNRPNPTSLSTSIAFDLPADGHATLLIYSVSGARIRTLVDGTLNRGRHTFSWDGTNDVGQQVAGGVYFYRLVAAGVTESRRLVYLR